jgi:hypothetical protein
LTPDLKLQVWSLLSWFSVIVFLGSIIGVVVWTLFMQNNELVQKFGKPGYQVTNGRFYSTYASYHYGMAVRFIFVGFELLCVCLAMLMTLDRIMEHVVRGMQAEIEAARQDNFWFAANYWNSLSQQQAAVSLAGVTLVAQVQQAKHQKARKLHCGTCCPVLHRWIGGEVCLRKHFL